MAFTMYGTVTIRKSSAFPPRIAPAQGTLTLHVKCSMSSIGQKKTRCVEGLEAGAVDTDDRQRPAQHWYA